MAKELEELWGRFSLTEEKEGITVARLGHHISRRERGKMFGGMYCCKKANQ